MKYLFTAFFLFVTTALYSDDFAGTPPALADASHSLASLEGDPKTIVYNSVNVITGDYINLETDISLPGVEPLTLQRFYCSANLATPNIIEAWPFNHFIQIGHFQDDDNKHIELHDSFGALLAFDKKTIRQECLNKRVTNTPQGVLSGQTNLKNKSLRTIGDETILKDGTGTSYHFPKLKESKRRLSKVKKANRNEVSYEYDHYHYENSNHHYITRILARNQPGKPLCDLNFRLERGSKKEKHLIVSSQGQDLATYHFKLAKYELDLKGDWQYLLTSVERRQDINEVYHYGILRNKHKNYSKLFKIERPDGRFLEIDYFREGDNAVWPGHNCAVNGERIGRVMHLKAPAGSQNTTIPIYRFLYDPSRRLTEVYDAENHLKTYHYNGDERLTKIETFMGNSPFHKYCEEHFEWGPPGTPDCANLKSKLFVSAYGSIIFSQNYEYDSQGNLLTEVLQGNLTGKEEWDSHYTGRCYSNDGLNLLIYENCKDKNLNYQYVYVNGTNLLESRLGIEGDQIRIREFFGYDEDGAITLEIIDNGSSYSKEDLSNVTERRIKRIKNSKTFPIGLPIEIAEFYWEENREHLLHRVENVYDKEGNLQEQKHFDSNNQFLYCLFWKYNQMGKIVEERNALGHVIQREYDPNGNLQVETEPQPGKRQVFATDRMNRLTEKQTFGPGLHFTETYRYDTLGNQIASIDIYGNETLCVYDDFGHPCKIIHPAVLNENGVSQNPVTTKTYNELGHVTSITDPCGHQTIAKYTVKGQPYYIRYPDGTEERFEYTLKGQLSKKIAPNGTYTLYTYDYQARPIKKETYSSAGQLLTCETRTYNAFYLVSETDASGLCTSYIYDGAGRLTSQKSGDKYTGYAYDNQGFVSEKRDYYDADNYISTHFRYDYLGQVLEEKEMYQGILHRHTSYAYDEAGNCTHTFQYHEEGTAVTSTRYNILNQPLQVTDPLGNVTHYRYEYGNCPTTFITDPKGNTTKITSDALGRQIETIVSNPFGQLIQKTTHDYDLKGNCIRSVETVKNSKTADKQIISVRKYDSMQRLTQSIEAFGEPEQTTISHCYNRYGQLEATTKPDGIELYYTYDDLGLLKTHTASDNSFDYHYEYNVMGLPICIEEHVQKTRTLKEYDPHGRLIQETLANDLSIRYSYDLLDRLIQLTLPDEGFIDYTYQGPHLSSVTRLDKTGTLYKHQYLKHTLLGQIKKTSLAAEVAEVDYNYDLKGMPRALESVHLKEEIQRDSLDNPTRRLVRDSVGSLEYNYTYDDLNQLAQETGAFTHTFVNDSLYNHVEKDGHSHRHSPLNQLLADQKGVYTYDLNGNRRTAKTDRLVEYIYDAQDRLISIKSDSNTVSYTYDEANRRLTKTYVEKGRTKTIRYFYAGMAELGAVEDERLVELRITGQEGAIAFEFQGQCYIPLYDHLGHVSCLLDFSGEVVETYRYSAFGEEQVFDRNGKRVTKSINPWRFSGKRFDSESGLIYFGLRYYDPETFTWITPDPIGREGGPNLYAYVLNNPLLHFDRFGLSAEVDDWLGHEVDNLRDTIERTDGTKNDSLRGTFVNAACGTCHGTADFMIGMIHGWHQLFLKNRASDIDIEYRAQIINFVQAKHEAQRVALNNWVVNSLSADDSNSTYQFFRQGTTSVLHYGSLVAATLSLVRGAITICSPVKTIEHTIGYAEAIVGRLGWELRRPNYQSKINFSKLINSRKYSGHALDQMQSRGIVPSVVENTIAHGKPYPTKPKTKGYYDSVNDVRVIINSETGEVVTAIFGAP